MSSLSGLVPSRYFFGAVAIYYQGSLQYSIVQKLLLGKSFPPSPAFQSSLWKSVPPVSSVSGLVPSRYFFGAVAVYYQGSLQYSIVQKLLLRKSFPPSPASQSSLWNSVPTVSSLSGSLPSSFGHCSGLLPGVSPVFDCTETILGEIVSTFASLPELSLKARPPGEFLSGSIPSRHLFGPVPSYYRRSLQYSIVQKLLLGILFLPSLAFQSSLWKSVPLVSSLSGSVPSRHLFGAVAVFYRGSLQYSIVEIILGEIFPTSVSLPELSLEARPLHEFSLGFGTIKASFWRCSDLLPEVSPLFDRTEATLGEVFPSYASLPEVSLEILPPCKFSLGFSTIKASFWRCSDLPPVVSPVFDCTETILGDIFPTYASLPEVSLEMRPTRKVLSRVRYHPGIVLAL